MQDILMGHGSSSSKRIRKIFYWRMTMHYQKEIAPRVLWIYIMGKKMIILK